MTADDNKMCGNKIFADEPKNKKPSFSGWL